MSKMSLDVDLLAVESFVPEPVQASFSAPNVGVGGDDTRDPEACNSPLCGPTYWKTCEQTQ